MIGDDLGQDYASVTTGTVGPTAINAMTATNQNQMETCPPATFVERVTRVITAKPVQKATQEKIAVFAIRGGGNGLTRPFYFLMY